MTKAATTPSGTPVAFTLLHITLTGSDILDANGDLKNTTAMEAIVNDLVTAQDVKNVMAQAAVADSAPAIAQAVTQDSLALSTVVASLPNVGKTRVDAAAQQKVSDTLATDSSAQTKVADIVSQDSAVAPAIDAAATQNAKDAVVQALVSSGSVADAAKSALESDPEAAATVSDAMVQAVTGKETDIANAISGSGSATSSDASVLTDAAPILQVKLTDKSGHTFTPHFHFALGSVDLVLDPDREFTPGIYTLDVTVTNPLTGDAQTLTQKFAWGVLAMNMDKDAYQVNDTGSLAIGVLDDKGAIVCDAGVKLSVTAPSGTVTEYATPGGGNFLSDLFGSSPSPITVTGTCGLKDSQNVSPDYGASIAFSEAGTYTLALTADTKNGERSMTQRVTVGGSPPVIVSRRAATRLYPIGTSPMDVTVTFNRDFSGNITDTVPGDFENLVASPDALIQKTASGNTLTWNGSWKAGTSATFHYSYEAPDISPDFFTVGPLQFTDANGSLLFQEQRLWEIANDTNDSTQQYIGGSNDGWAMADGGILQFPALTTTSSPWVDGLPPYVGGNNDGWAMAGGGAIYWTGAAGDGKCSTAGNWDRGAPLTTSDVVIPAGTSSITWDAGCPSTVNSLTLANGFTGTGTFAGAFSTTATLTVSSGALVTATAGNGAIAVGTNLTLGRGGTLKVRSSNTTGGGSGQIISVGGNLLVGTGGLITANGQGFTAGNGPGKAIAGCAGGSYGGMGSVTTGDTSGPTYGSIIAPASLGSAGCLASGNAGGGAITLNVTGSTNLYGSVSANGYANGAAGGSIDLTTSSLSGPSTAAIRANGGSATVEGGGGGRVAVILTNVSSTFSGFAGGITAFGGGGSYIGAAGTVYEQTGAGCRARSPHHRQQQSDRPGRSRHRPQRPHRHQRHRRFDDRPEQGKFSGQLG